MIDSWLPVCRRLLQTHQCQMVVWPYFGQHVWKDTAGALCVNDLLEKYIPFIYVIHIYPKCVWKYAPFHVKDNKKTCAFYGF